MALGCKLNLHVEQSRLDLDDLRLIAALAETGSLAAAARSLRVNHASAWRRLGALEQRLGVRLFERSRSGYAATSAGEAAVAVAIRTLSEVAELERRLVGQDIRPSGMVRLTTTETLLDLVAPALLDLRRSHPGIIVDLVTDNAFFTLTRRDADIALRPAGRAPEGLVARRLADIATAVYGSFATRVEDAATADWVAPDDSLAHLGSARWITTNVAPERIVMRASSLIALRIAAGEGIGLAALPCFMGDRDPRLVRVLPPLPEMATSLWLLTHPDLRHTARVRVVLDALAAHFARQRQCLDGSGGVTGTPVSSQDVDAKTRPPRRSARPRRAAGGSS